MIGNIYHCDNIVARDHTFGMHIPAFCEVVRQITWSELMVNSHCTVHLIGTIMMHEGNAENVFSVE